MKSPNIWAKLDDGSILDQNGIFRFISVDRLVDKILSGNCCIVCGKEKKAKDFNDEHVIPDWILRKFSIQNRTITLPNRTNIKYSQYKVPCCIDCNNRMGEKLEKPISEIINGGIDSINNELSKNGPSIFLSWMAYIFFKTHFKDSFLRLNRDRRKENYLIGDLYDWAELHHVYCLARAQYANALITNSALTSFITIPVIDIGENERFDYSDNFSCMSSMIRFGDYAFISVFNDGCAAMNMEKENLKKIRKPLHPIQLRELFARISYDNYILSNRPEYGTGIDFDKSEIFIDSDIESNNSKTIEIENEEPERFGSLMAFLCEILVNQMSENPAEELELIKTGTASYILDENGEFIEFIKNIENS